FRFTGKGVSTVTEILQESESSNTSEKKSPSRNHDGVVRPITNEQITRPPSRIIQFCRALKKATASSEHASPSPAVEPPFARALLVMSRSSSFLLGLGQWLVSREISLFLHGSCSRAMHHVHVHLE